MPKNDLPNGFTFMIFVCVCLKMFGTVKLDVHHVPSSTGQQTRMIHPAIFHPHHGHHRRRGQHQPHGHPHRAHGILHRAPTDGVAHPGVRTDREGRKEAEETAVGVQRQTHDVHLSRG